MIVTTVIIYLILQFALCFYISKKIQTESDFFVAGRNLPIWMVSISLFATWFGAETCIGSAAEVFSDGLSGSRADPFGYSLCLLLSGLLIAPKIWNKKYVTLADFLHDRYNQKVAMFVAVILALSSLIWAAAQLRAFAQVISATTDVSLDITLLGGFIFIMAYTLMGGLLGDVITDVIQSVVIVVGLVLLMVGVFNNTENISELFASVSTQRWSFIGEGESLMARMDRWAIPILGSLIVQEVVARIQASRDVKVAVKSCYISCGIYLIFGMIPVVLGLIGPSLLQNYSGDAEHFLIDLAKQNLSPFVMAIFAGALISAILATIDSILLSVGSLLCHNILIPKMAIKDTKEQLLLSRIVVLICGITAYIVAVYSEGIYDLLETSSSFGTAGVLVVTLIGLWFKFGGALAAGGALVVGIVTTPIAEHVFSSESPFIMSILMALACYAVLSMKQFRNAT